MNDVADAMSLMDRVERMETALRMYAENGVRVSSLMVAQAALLKTLMVEVTELFERVDALEQGITKR